VTVSNEFDPVTLDTWAAPFNYDDHSVPIAVAPEHAYTDPQTGEVLHFYASFQPPQYTVYSVAVNTSTRVILGNVPVNPKVNQPLYQHSFGTTANYIIMSEIPCTYGKTFADFQFLPELGVTWRVISRATGQQVATFTSDSFFMFHHANAFEVPSENLLVVDLITYPNSSILTDGFYLDNLKYNYQLTLGVAMTTRPMRFLLPLDFPGVQVTGQVLAELPAEMPVVNPSYASAVYHYFYGITINSSNSAWFDTLFKLNVDTGNWSTWIEENCYPIEPIFVENPEAKFEDDGVVLSLILNVSNNSTFLLILDGQTFQELARVNLPFFIPFGFHGKFYPNE